MRFFVTDKPKLCRQRLHEALDSPFTALLPATYERFSGIVAGPLFAVRYQSDEHTWRRMNPVFIKAVGLITGQKGTASVRYLTFRGLTDPFSLLFIYACAFLIFHFLWRHVEACLGFAAIWTALVALTTLTATMLFESGGENVERLEHYICAIMQSDA